MLRTAKGSLRNTIKKETHMLSRPRRIFLRIISALMLLAAVPMFFLCWSLINGAALDKDFAYAGAGCFAAGIVYIFSVPTAVAGLVFAGHRHRVCRVIGYIQLAAAALLVVPLGAYIVLTLPPLILLTVLYMFGVGWREKRDCEQQ
jgi:hypothetical protein